jgi:CHASE2 domain-containing sensor protein/signal transduction histidine kinase
MKAREPHHRGWGQMCGLAVLLFLLAVALSTVPVIRDGELRFTDTFFRILPVPKQRSQVVLVTIDDESLQRYGRWPWSRTLLAKLTNNLAQAKASVIGLDILLSEPQSPQADAALEKALHAGPTVIVDKIAAYPTGPKWIEPVPQFAQSVSAVGHAQAVLDVDSVCRRYPVHQLTLDGPRWAFAVEVARRIEPERTAVFLASYHVPVSDTGPVSTAQPVLVRIPFRRGGFDTLSARAVLEGFDPTMVSGRPVLIGFGSAEIVDRLSTPLHPEFPTPGVEVHAQILDSILTARTLRELPLWAGALTLLITSMLAVGVFRAWRGFSALWVLCLMGASVYAIALLTFVVTSYLLPAGSMLLAVGGAPVLVYTADFVRVERSLTEQLHSLRSWLAWRGKDSVAYDTSDLSWRLRLLEQLQTELGSLYELHKTLLESTQDLIAIFDEQGKLLLNNRAFANAHRLHMSAAPSLQEVRTLWIVSNEVPLVLNGAVEEGEISLDQELYSARIAPLPPTKLSPQGGTIVTLTNLRTRVERDRARAEALGFITHELRTPLASVQGFAELMMQYPDSPACAAAPETIFRESKRLLALISSYLDVLRLDAGAKPITADLVELEGVIGQVFDILHPLANAAGMRLVHNRKNNITVIGDTPLISGAVLNLVSNAIKYGKPGTDIEVHCSHENNEVIIGVHNVGAPLAQEEISRLFDPYYRASNVEKGKTGWGLGLAFVKRIAEKHGGSVRAESQPAGILFEIHLPAVTEPAVVAKEIS